MVIRLFPRAGYNLTHRVFRDGIALSVILTLLYKQAKNEVKNTVKAYLSKDAHGEYVIPQINGGIAYNETKSALPIRFRMAYTIKNPPIIIFFNCVDL